MTFSVPLWHYISLFELFEHITETLHGLKDRNKKICLKGYYEMWPLVSQRNFFEVTETGQKIYSIPRRDLFFFFCQDLAQNQSNFHGLH